MRIKDLPLTNNVSGSDIVVVDQGINDPVTRRAPVAALLQAQSLNAPSAVTLLGSPFTLQNTQGYALDVVISGGGVSNLEFSRDGTNWYSTGSFYGAFALSSNDRLRITYSVAPTVTLIPR
jgi:hypothetical protein